jgi:Rhodopirellula transposase DDE domain
VNVGIDHDTAQFAVASIRSWWEQLGQPRYPNATRLQITADCGGSNGNRTRLWKVELQKLADDTGLQLAVCHFPPGTSTSVPAELSDELGRCAPRCRSAPRQRRAYPDAGHQRDCLALQVSPP